MARMKFNWMSLIASVMLVSGCGVAGPSLGAKAPVPGAYAAAGASKTPYKLSKTYESENWDKIERLTHTYDGFPVERARQNGRHLDPEIVRAFGTEFPASRDVLLHYGKNWQKGKGTPILLVHGSILEATSAWVNPHGKEGLAKTLSDQGFRVFAVTFAHRHGDNYLWAEQIANAIQRVREVTGAEQVDVISHSKGTVAARALVSGVRLPWMSRYNNDIRKLVMIGGPHLGIDFTYRHPIVNYGLFPEKDETIFNAPMSWTKMLVMGAWVDTSAQTFYTDNGNFFPGQAQMLYRWDKEYPLSKTEQDWYTTYYGGQGFVSSSPGIDKAIEQGGHFIDKLRKSPLPAKIQLAVLAGDRATMKNILNETSGPSDGVVFVKSSTYTDDMTKGGAKLIAKDVIHHNHMELIYDPEAKAWVVDVLKK